MGPVNGRPGTGAEPQRAAQCSVDSAARIQGGAASACRRGADRQAGCRGDATTSDAIVPHPGLSSQLLLVGRCPATRLCRLARHWQPGVPARATALDGASVALLAKGYRSFACRGLLPCVAAHAAPALGPTVQVGNGTATSGSRARGMPRARATGHGAGTALESEALRRRPRGDRRKGPTQPKPEAKQRPHGLRPGARAPPPREERRRVPLVSARAPVAGALRRPGRRGGALGLPEPPHP